MSDQLSVAHWGDIVMWVRQVVHSVNNTLQISPPAEYYSRCKI